MNNIGYLVPLKIGNSDNITTNDYELHEYKVVYYHLGCFPDTVNIFSTVAPDEDDDLTLVTDAINDMLEMELWTSDLVIVSIKPIKC